MTWDRADSTSMTRKPSSCSCSTRFLIYPHKHCASRVSAYACGYALRSKTINFTCSHVLANETEVPPN